MLLVKNKDSKPPLFYGAANNEKSVPAKGILFFGDTRKDGGARWLVSDTRPEDIEVRSDFLRTPSNPILITGPSGTGKTQLARQIHNRIYPGSSCFRPVNCALLTRELMISQVFGHVKGSFTGACRDNPGILKECAEGSVFLDEIDRLDREVQGRLLSLLDKPYEYFPLGAEGDEERKMKCTATLIFATNKNIADLISSGVLESDLYYRISHFFTIDLKPLASHQLALERSVRVHWEEKKRQLCAEEYGPLEQEFPEAWKLFTDRMAVHYAGNHRDVKKLVTEIIFRLKSKKYRKEPETISAEEAREILMTVDSRPFSRKAETPFDELCMDERLKRLAEIVAANPAMTRKKAAMLGGLGGNVNPINRIIASIKNLTEKPGPLSRENWEALLRFAGRRRKGGKN